MTDDPIIRVEGLGKKYSLRHLRDQRYVALRDVLVEKATGLFRRNGRKTGRRDNETTGQQDQGPAVSGQSSSGPRIEEFWALRDINFSVRRGEVVGIIGRNGAGKSTLLKILSRITDPTEGRVRLKGRVASLLEVGTGFHPELTGRENIYLNGAILGMSRAEIKKKFDEIVAFAETEKFLDTPVKRYSSGMYVRLAFAVAAHLEPEILVIDEVLAVGDAEFQKKCLGKMSEVARGGRTVLFVSHNMAAVQSLCSRALVIKQGKQTFDGSAGEGVQHYLAHEHANSTVNRAVKQNGEPTITFAKTDVIGTHKDPYVEVMLEITSSRACTVSLELRLLDQLGMPCGLASCGLLDPTGMLRLHEGVNVVRCRFPARQLARGQYHLTVQIAVPLVTILDMIDSGLEFYIERSAAFGNQRVMEQGWGYGAHEMPLTVEAR
jgi:lipopolysaccharide transport system ATP-binding protein